MNQKKTKSGKNKSNANYLSNQKSRKVDHQMTERDQWWLVEQLARKLKSAPFSESRRRLIQVA